MRLSGWLWLALALGCAGAQAGETPSDAFRRFGLDGTWSPDCSRPPARDNPHVVWRPDAAGAVTHRVTLDGALYGAPSTVTDVAVLSGSLIQFTLEREGGPRFVVTVERTGDRMRTLRSVGAEGRVYYEGGVDLSSGKASVFYERCGAAGPES